jgi:pyruvate ferredoxin oxidoreductase delta subunit
MKRNLMAGAVITNTGSTIKTKTSGWRTFKPVLHIKKCIQCMLCWMNCPDIAIPQKNGKRLETNLDFCKGCGICSEVCPVRCIDMVKEQK